jgi:RTX calcium-binding nonapeptide repeat (4 copies)
MCWALGLFPSRADFFMKGFSMALFLFRNWFGLQQRVPRRRQQRAASRPLLEVLEGRIVPTTLAPAFTSAGSTTFTVGAPGSFPVTTTSGSSIPGLSETGALPGGVTFVDNGNGTATLAGTPNSGTGGVYNLALDAHTVGYQFDLTTSYEYYDGGSEETGFLTVTNNGASTFTGTVGLYNGATRIDFGPSTTTLNPGDSIKIQAGTDSSDVGGFNLNGSNPSNGLQILMTGTVSKGSASEGVNLSVYDKDVHTGVFQTNPFNVTMDSYVLEGGDPYGRSTGHVYETAQPDGHYTFLESAPTGGVGYQFDLASSYQFYGNSGEETGFLTITNHGASTFIGTVGLYNGATAITSTSTTLNPGDSVILQAGDDSSDSGGFNLTGGASNGIQVLMTGTVTQGSGSEAVNLSVYDKDIHSGAFQTNPFGVFMDNYVLEGGDPFGGNPGHVYETSQPSASYTFAEIAPDVTQNFTLTVNEAPTITSANNATFQVGAAGTFTVTTGHSYPASPTLSETGALPSGVAFVDNGNGAATLSGTPDVGTDGSYSITITAQNGVSPDAAQTFTLTVSPLNAGTIQLLRDPINPSSNALVVNGTANDDTIMISKGPGANKVTATITSSGLSVKQTFSTSAFDRIIVYGGEGNDHIQVGNEVVAPAILLGGAGNDTIVAGGGPTIEVGGAGNDVLTGGPKNDILIGGGGSDVLVGKGRNNILIAGTTAYDSKLVALGAIMNVWETTTDTTYAANVAALGGSSFTYKLDATTVHDDGVGNLLFAGSGLDWIFANENGVGNNGATDTVIGARKKDDVVHITL